MAFSDVSSVTSHFATPNEGFSTTTSSQVSAGATTVGLNSVSGLTNGAIFVGVIEPGEAKEQVFTGTVDTGGSQITGVLWVKGDNVLHASGVSVVDYDTGAIIKMLIKGLLVSLDQDGTLKAGAVDGAGVLASSVVETAKIKDLAVTTAKLDDKSVTGEKLHTPVAFYATTTQTINDGTTPDVTSYTEVVDYGSDFASGVFTAPYQGFYHFNANLAFTDAAGRIEVSILVDGTSKARGYGDGGASNHDPTATVGLSIALTAGQEVKVQAVNNTGGNEALVNSSFSGFLVGRTT